MLCPTAALPTEPSKGRGEFALTVQGRVIPTTELALRQHRPTLAWQMAADANGVRSGTVADPVLQALDRFLDVAAAGDLME